MRHCLVATLALLLVSCTTPAPERCVVRWEGSDLEQVVDGHVRAGFQAQVDAPLVRACAYSSAGADIVLGLSEIRGPGSFTILGATQAEPTETCLLPTDGAFDDITIEQGKTYRINVYGDGVDAIELEIPWTKGCDEAIAVTAPM